MIKKQGCDEMTIIEKLENYKQDLLDKIGQIDNCINVIKELLVDDIVAENKELKEKFAQEGMKVDRLTAELKAKDERIEELKAELERYKPKSEWANEQALKGGD
jgi:uncharacterized coiled-coil DUF342 family protein